jgi:hypothetical protein
MVAGQSCIAGPSVVATSFHSRLVCALPLLSPEWATKKAPAAGQCLKVPGRHERAHTVHKALSVVCSVYTHIAVEQCNSFMVSEPLAERKPFCFFRQGVQVFPGENRSLFLKCLRTQGDTERV